MPKKKNKSKKKVFEFSSSTTKNGFLEILVADSIGISVRDNKALYVSVGDWTYYIDDSTNEQIIHKFKRHN
jgi:spore coat polysaccharide biosynthesis predicted glycosyltransferase SpsG